VQFGVVLAAAGAHGLGGAVGWVGGQALDLQDLGPLREVDAGQVIVQGGALPAVLVTVPRSRPC